ncbi:ABC transporter substrate-binding protein [bacterium]|nr:ABC transporter substrate-binding protein [bacterium]
MYTIDQMKRRIEIPQKPKRIVSLVPSQTEFLYAIDVKPIAQTLFCVEPEAEFKKATKIGGTKKLKINKIKELQPDLIIGNKEENTKSEIEELELEFPVWMSDIKSLEDALDMMTMLGAIVDRKEQVSVLRQEIEQAFTQKFDQSQSALYLIWNKPYMVAGRDTFINTMLDKAGFRNAIKNPLSRYPEITDQEIVELNPAVVLLSSEPFPFKQKHIDQIQKLLPNAKIALVDGTYFSWYGSRLAAAPTYFKRVQNQLLAL